MWIVGFWILFSTINSIAISLAIPGGGAWTVLCVLLLLATLFFGVIFLTNPLVGGIAVWIWLAFSLIVYGVCRIVFAGQMKALRNRTDGMI